MQKQPIKSPLEYLQLPEGEVVVNVQPYRVETAKPARWQFWRNEIIKFNIAVLTNSGRFFIIDPDNLTLEEKPN